MINLFKRREEIRSLEIIRTNLYSRSLLATNIHRIKVIDAFNNITDEINSKLYWWQRRRPKIVTAKLLDVELE